MSVVCVAVSLAAAKSGAPPRSGRCSRQHLTNGKGVLCAWCLAGEIALPRRQHILAFLYLFVICSFNIIGRRHVDSFPPPLSQWLRVFWLLVKFVAKEGVVLLPPSHQPPPSSRVYICLEIATLGPVHTSLHPSHNPAQDHSRSFSSLVDFYTDLFTQVLLPQLHVGDNS